MILGCDAVHEVLTCVHSEHLRVAWSRLLFQGSVFGDSYAFGISTRRHMAITFIPSITQKDSVLRFADLPESPKRNLEELPTSPEQRHGEGSAMNKHYVDCIGLASAMWRPPALYSNIRERAKRAVACFVGYIGPCERLPDARAKRLISIENA